MSKDLFPARERLVVVCGYMGAAIPGLFGPAIVGIALTWFGGGVLTLLAPFVAVSLGLAGADAAEQSYQRKDSVQGWIAIGCLTLVPALAFSLWILATALSALSSDRASESDAGRVALAVLFALWGMHGGALHNGFRQETKRRRRTPGHAPSPHLSRSSFYLGALPAVILFILVIWWNSAVHRSTP